MAFIPSIRECCERARPALEATDEVLAWLDNGPRPAEIAGARQHLVLMRQLVADMLANMRNAGVAYTPAPPAPPKLPARSVYDAPRTKPPAPSPVSAWPTDRSGKVRQSAAVTPTARPAAVAPAPAPKPSKKAGPTPAPKPPRPRQQPAPKCVPPQPAGTLTTAQAAAYLGIGESTMYALRADPKAGFPKPCGRWQRNCLFTRQALDQYRRDVSNAVADLRQRATPTRRPGGTNSA